MSEDVTVRAIETEQIVEPISPELALVDPELAARARQSLPLPGDFRAYGRASAQPLPVPPSEPAPELVHAEPSPEVVYVPAPPPEVVHVPGPPRRRRPALISLVAIAFLLALAVSTGWSLFRTPPGTLAPLPAVERGGTSTSTSQSGSRGSTKSAQSSGRGTRPAPQHGTTGAARRRPRASASHRRQPARAAGPTLRWRAVFGARAYRVTLQRLLVNGRGRKVLDVTTPVPHLTLPLSWRQGRHRYRLLPGRYRWRLYVLSGVPPRRGIELATHKLLLT
jgi:hypothetical protein